MESKFYQCKLDHHLRCDMDMKCLKCIKTENTWAEKWIKAVKADNMDGRTPKSQVIEPLHNDTTEIPV